MASRRRKLDEALGVVRRILWEDWDPIGVNDSPEARTEYDSYAATIVRKVADGVRPRDLAIHLGKLETSAMGLQLSPLDGREQVATKICQAIGNLVVD